MCRYSNLLNTIVVLLMLTGSALASGILPGDSNAYIQGDQLFYNYYTGSREINAVVEYAVYAPLSLGNSFENTFGEVAEIGDDDWVYAYQIFSNASPDANEISAFTVGLNGGDELPIYIGSIVDTSIPNTTPPSDNYFVQTPPDPPVSAKWNFVDTENNDAGIPNDGGVSDILFFTSPFGPETDYASLMHTRGCTSTLPSPVPEPATLHMLIIIALSLMFRRVACKY
ncbi:MAG: hypothetical protein JXM70_16090 [Pirellulales bacterium]|nr:hypothetical protein [Pirellulales bacterium]